MEILKDLQTRLKPVEKIETEIDSGMLYIKMGATTVCCYFRADESIIKGHVRVGWFLLPKDIRDEILGNIRLTCMRFKIKSDCENLERENP